MADSWESSKAGGDQIKLLFPKCNENSSSMFSMEETEAAADNINYLNIELWLHNNNILKLGADILGISLFKSIDMHA